MCVCRGEKNKVFTTMRSSVRFDSFGLFCSVRRFNRVSIGRSGQTKGLSVTGKFHSLTVIFGDS